jgi:Flp pilus assembly pilin Flp
LNKKSFWHQLKWPIRVALLILLLGLIAVVLVAALSSSSQDRGNALPKDRDQIEDALRRYWDGEKDYTLGFTNAMGDLVYAEVEGDEATADAEIILGYTRPTEGAGYRVVTFRLRRDKGDWIVTYDGWIDEELE